MYGPRELLCWVRKPYVVDELSGIVLGDDLDLHHATRGDEDLANAIAEIQDVGGLVEVVLAFFEHGSQRLLD